MPEESINAEGPLEEQLVAYLDGELDAKASRRIEELLATDPQVRQKLHRLERTWEMLDELDSTPVGEQFTRTTLEMVAVAAREDVQKVLEETPRRRRRQWLWAGGGMLGAGLAGFLIIALGTTDQNRQLLDELPVLESLDEYRQIGDIKFLNLLQRENLFVKEEENESTLPPLVSDKEDILKHVKSLSLSQKADLLRKQERFAGLGQAVEEQLNQLYKEIQQAPAAEDLPGIMGRYYEWWRSLTPYSRAELTAMSPEERIAWIKKHLQEQQTKIAGNPPTTQDAKELWSWLEDYAAKRKKQLIERLTSEQRQWLDSLHPSVNQSQILMMMMIWQGTQSGVNRKFHLAPDDLRNLISKFTPETRKRLEILPPAEQMKIVQNWIHYITHQRHIHSLEELGSLVDDDRLSEFFEKDLSAEQRDHLMSLSGEDMKRELLRMYIMRTTPPKMLQHFHDESRTPQ